MKYKCIKPFQYYDVLIAKEGDIISINSGSVTNVTTSTTYDTEYIPVEDLKGNLEYITDDQSVTKDINKNLVDNEMDKLLKSEWFSNYNKNILKKLIKLGILKTTETSCQDYHVGNSDYSKHIIQPWHIWQDYNLNPWDADITKRILRTKVETNMSESESRIMDYKKIIHICNERIRQLNNNM